MVRFMFSVYFSAPEPFDVVIREPSESPKGELSAANDGPMPLLSICASYGMGGCLRLPPPEITDT